ncbi:MAG: FHA domain-containing serine/threonine-protein kinase [Chloroflexota bacterium]
MLKPGDKLLNYEIIRLLGQGGTATVYLARDVNLDVQVALKVLREENDLRQSVMAHRLRTGAKAAAQLRHAHIQQVYYQGIDTASDTPFVAMEYLPGGDLRARIGQLGLDQALVIFADVCAAVGYAHDHGVVHRDLKPDNVMFNARGEVVVTDFDLARMEGAAGRTVAGQAMGTLQYLSPEQARGDPIDQATDIYALGVILFELVTGTWPFASKNPADILRAHFEAPPPRASGLNPAVPSHVDAAVQRAMAKSPKERFQHAGDLAAAALGRAAEPAPAAPPAPDDEYLPTMLEKKRKTPSLEILDGALAGKKFALGAATTLGYSSENTITLPDEYASGLHARIDREADTCLLRDLKSTNGTRLNGIDLAPDAPRALQPGDVIEIGDTHLRFVL